MMLALLNVVTGILTSNTIEAMSTDKEALIAEEMARYQNFEREMRLMFQEIDVDGDNRLTMDELQAYLTDDRVKAHFRVLGIDAHEACAIFRLLDLSDKGSLDLDEFVMGAFRIKGGGRNMDISTLLYENKRMVSDLSNRLDQLEGHLVGIASDLRDGRSRGGAL